MKRTRAPVLAAILFTACTSAGPPSNSAPPTTAGSSSGAPSATAPASGGSPSATVEATTPVVERVEVADDGRSLVMVCEGEGSPTIVLEDGHPSETGGVARFSTGPMWDALTAETRVCAYDRAGYANSDPAPSQPRTADDVVDDLQNALAAAGEEGPYLLVGSSFGGMIVTYFAAREPDQVAGVVLLDVPAPTDTLTLEEMPELAWDHPANPEHVDVIPEFETRFARNPEPMEAPLVVLTAADGASDVEDQSFWLEHSPNARQVQLSGGHDLDLSNPTQVAAEILAALEAAR